MDPVVLLIFVLVYLGMLLGRYPALVLDRTGIALLGAIALLATEKVGPEAAWESIDVPTIALLFGLMLVSAQFRLGGFYARVTRQIAALRLSPQGLLAVLVAVSGGLSALLANDIVCLAMTPVLLEGCARRNLRPLPYLLGLACAANAGSALTLIGNPQNMLIGQRLGLSFAGYLAEAAVPALGGLVLIWLVLCWQFRGRWQGGIPVPEPEAPPFNAWQSLKGGLVLTGLVGVFLFSAFPREVAALAAAGILLTSRKMATRNMLGLVDWHLLVLFGALFIVNHAFETAGGIAALTEGLRQLRIDPAQPAPLFLTTVALSNLVSNVPAVMLLLPLATHPLSGPILALASTLAGNLLIVGSIANIIVVEQAGRMGVTLGWREHLRTGFPVTMLTLALSAVWLWARAGG